jgi:predicted RNA binding protein YcfA (HicA-like mRNA interferase family)
MKPREVAGRIMKLGGLETAGRGAHRKYTVGTCRTVIAFHPGDIPSGTLRQIEKDLAPCLGAGWLTR